MKVALIGVAALGLVMGCGAGAADKPANTAGSANAGNGGAGLAAGSGGMAAGGGQGQSGSSMGGAAAGSGAGGGAGGGSGAGTAGSGGSGGSGTQGFTCPAGAVDAPKLTGLTPMRVVGVPPADDFNNNNNDTTNIEGPVWVGDALYVSEINFTKPNPPPARVLKITASGQVSIAIAADSGTNGLAINPAGELFGALHKDGSISKLSLSGGAATPVVSMFMGKRFSSPNDLAFHTNGTLYFSDPKWQAPAPNPQTAMRAYRVAPGSSEAVVIEELDQPNGMTLSKNQDFLYIGGNQLKKYPVMADGTVGAGTTFVQGGSTDGMAIDCADNLYTTGNGVTVYSPAGAPIGTISVNGLSSVTNVAFGGADHKTLYITSQGNKDQKGLWQVAMNIPGMPY